MLFLLYIGSIAVALLFSCSVIMGAGGEPQSAISTSDSAPTVVFPSSAKTVYLIRHAESEENRRLASLKRCLGQLGKFSLPSKGDISSSVGLLNVYAQVDSDVSDVGQRQIEQLQRKLEKDDFVATKSVKLVAHSPLKRARQTCQGMLGCCGGGSADDDQMLVAPGVQRVEELQLLTEKTPEEWIPGNYKSFSDRMAAFEKWLGEQPEDVVAIVGHSQYFKAMLGLSFKFGNCDVWEVQFGGATEEVSLDATNGSGDGSKEEAESTTNESFVLSPGWRGLKRLYTFSDEERVASVEKES